MKKTYAGTIKNQGAQKVSALFKSEKKTNTKKKVGSDLRNNCSK